MGLIMLLSACSSTPSAPYWENQKWNESLFNAVQGSLHYPDGANEQRTEPVEGKVGFTYVQGHLQDVVIVNSTGTAVLDEAMLQQVSAAEVPAASGLHAEAPRRYELVLHMPTPISDFFVRMRVAAHRNMSYPREAVISGITGAVVVAFDYQAGKISNIQVMKSSGSKLLDNAALHDISYVKVAPPAEHADERLHLQLLLCYSLGKLGADACPGYKEIIEVINTP